MANWWEQDLPVDYIQKYLAKESDPATRVQRDATALQIRSQPDPSSGLPPDQGDIKLMQKYLTKDTKQLVTSSDNWWEKDAPAEQNWWSQDKPTNKETTPEDYQQLYTKQAHELINTGKLQTPVPEGQQGFWNGAKNIAMAPIGIAENIPGMAAWGAGALGAGAIGVPAMLFDKGAPKEIYDWTQSLAYTPRTEIGKSITGGVGTAFELAKEYLVKGAEWVSDADKLGTKEGEPGFQLRAAMSSLAQAIPEILTAKGGVEGLAKPAEIYGKISELKDAIKQAAERKDKQTSEIPTTVDDLVAQAKERTRQNQSLSDYESTAERPTEQPVPEWQRAMEEQIPEQERPQSQPTQMEVPREAEINNAFLEKKIRYFLDDTNLEKVSDSQLEGFLKSLPDDPKYHPLVNKIRGKLVERQVERDTAALENGKDFKHKAGDRFVNTADERVVVEKRILGNDNKPEYIVERTNSDGTKQKQVVKEVQMDSWRKLSGPRPIGPNQRGGPKFEPKQSKVKDQTKISLESKQNVEKIINILRSVGSKQAFIEKLKTSNLDPIEKAKALENIDDLWNHSPSIIEKFADVKSTFSELGAGERALALDPRPIAQIIKEEAPEKGLNIDRDDMKEIMTDVLPSEQIKLHKGKRGGFGLKLYTGVVDRVRDITDNWSRIANEFLHGENRKSGIGISNMRNFKIDHKNSFMAPIFELKTQEIHNVFKAWLDLEKRPELLGGEIWASEKILREKYGLTDREVAAKLAFNKLMEGLLKFTNIGLQAAGKHPIMPIPEYFPHVLKGRFRVHVQNKEGLVEIQGFKTKYQALKYIKDFKEDKILSDNGFSLAKDKTGVEYFGAGEVVKWSNFASDLAIATNLHMSRGKLNGLLRERLDKLETQQQGAFIKHSMERTVNASGYIGSKQLRESYYGGRVDTWEVQQVINNYTKEVFRYAKNADIDRNVTQPVNEFMRTGADLALPKTQKIIDGFLSNATGQNLNKAQVLDNFIDNLADNKAFGAAGISADSLRKLVPFTNRVLLVHALAGSASFVVVQMLQPLQSAMFMPIFQHMLKSEGHKVVGSVSMAMARAYKELYTSMSPEGKEALEYAVKNHITDSAIWEALDESLNLNRPGTKHLIKGVDWAALRPWATRVESTSRANVFLQGYFFAKNSGLTKEASLGFATRYTDVVMGNYSKTFRPLMMTNYGTVGKMYSPFATLANTYLGNVASVIRNMGDIKNLDSATKAMVTLAGLNIAFSGLSGTIGINEWNQLASWWNDRFPDHQIPTPQSVLQKHNLPDAVIYGLASESTKAIPGLEHGVHIGSALDMPTVFGRAGVPSTVVSGATAEAAYLTLSTAWREAAKLSGIDPVIKGLNREEEYRLGASILPPAFKPYLENKYGINGGTPFPGSLQTFYKRDVGFEDRAVGPDTAARGSGYRSVTEQKAMDIAQAMRKEEANRRNAIKELTHDTVMRLASGMEPEQVQRNLEKAAVEFGGDPKDIINNATKRIRDMSIPERERLIIDAKNWKTQQNYSQYDKVSSVLGQMIGIGTAEAATPAPREDAGRFYIKNGKVMDGGVVLHPGELDAYIARQEAAMKHNAKMGKLGELANATLLPDLNNAKDIRKRLQQP